MLRIKNKHSKAEATISDEQWNILVRKGWARKYEILSKEVEGMPAKKGSFIPPEIKTLKDKEVSPQKISDGALPELKVSSKRKIAN